MTQERREKLARKKILAIQKQVDYLKRLNYGLDFCDGSHCFVDMLIPQNGYSIESFDCLSADFGKIDYLFPTKSTNHPARD